MTLARPLLLLALLSLPVVWLLARREAARRLHPVSSLLLWKKLALAPEPPVELRRRADRRLWLRLAGAAAISLGLAGPGLAPPAPSPVLHVLVDSSPSMSAFAESTAEVLARLEARAGDARVRVHRRRGLSGLGSILAAAGDGTVVVVTDHVPKGFAGGGRVRLALVGEPVENAGVVSGWLTGEEFAVVVRNHGPKPRRIEVVHPGGRRALPLAPGADALVRGPAPGGRAEIYLTPGDRFAFDDAVTLERVAPVRVELAWRGPDEPHARLALSLAGVTTTGDEAEAVYRGEPGTRTRLLLSPPGPRRRIVGPVAGTAELSPSAVPGPEVALGSAAPLEPGGLPLLTDALGPLAVVRGGRVEIALDPAETGSAWSADASFPVFFAEVARLLGARPAGTRIAAGTIDPVESATRPVKRELDLDGLGFSREGEPGMGRPLAPWLYLLAAVCILTGCPKP